MAKIRHDVASIAIDKTFGLRTAAHMFQKLRWEADRLKRVKREDASSRNYQTIDFAITANSVIEWLCWELYERGQCISAVRHLQLRLDLPTNGMYPERSVFFKEVRNYAHRESRFMHACMQIANAAKHRNVKHADKQITTEPGEPMEFGGGGVYIKIVEQVPSAITQHTLAINAELVSADLFAAEVITWIEKFARGLWDYAPGCIRPFSFWNLPRN